MVEKINKQLDPYPGGDMTPWGAEANKGSIGSEYKNIDPIGWFSSRSGVVVGEGYRELVTKGEFGLSSPVIGRGFDGDKVVNMLVKRSSGEVHQATVFGIVERAAEDGSTEQGYVVVFDNPPGVRILEVNAQNDYLRSLGEPSAPNNNDTVAGHEIPVSDDRETVVSREIGGLLDPLPEDVQAAVWRYAIAIHEHEVSSALNNQLVRSNLGVANKCRELVQELQELRKLK